MALIKCKECGKEISDTVKKCPNCGYKEKKKISKKKFIIIGAVVLTLIIIGGIVAFITREKPLTQEEKIAVECILDYKPMLKNPDSLQVHDIRIKRDTAEDEEDYDAVIIYMDVSGQNGFGGNTRDIIRYVYHNDDGRVVYTGSDDDEDDDNFLKQVVAKIIKDEYPELLKDDETKISVERVMKEINKKQGKEY